MNNPSEMGVLRGWPSAESFLIFMSLFCGSAFLFLRSIAALKANHFFKFDNPTHDRLFSSRLSYMGITGGSF